MAITTIDNLQEIQTAGENDVLPISTGNGVKKIKASALGGGGAEEMLVTFTLTESGEEYSVSTETSISAILTAYGQGKVIKGVAEVDGYTLLFDLAALSESESSVFFFTFGTEGGTMRIAGYSEGTDEWSFSALS